MRYSHPEPTPTLYRHRKIENYIKNGIQHFIGNNGWLNKVKRWVCAVGVIGKPAVNGVGAA